MKFKLCQYCKEEIKIAAVKCRYCNERLGINLECTETRDLIADTSKALKKIYLEQLAYNSMNGLIVNPLTYLSKSPSILFRNSVNGVLYSNFTDLASNVTSLDQALTITSLISGIPQTDKFLFNNIPLWILTNRAFWLEAIRNNDICIIYIALTSENILNSSEFQEFLSREIWGDEDFVVTLCNASYFMSAYYTVFIELGYTAPFEALTQSHYEAYDTLESFISHTEFKDVHENFSNLSLSLTEWEQVKLVGREALLGQLFEIHANTHLREFDSFINYFYKLLNSVNKYTYRATLEGDCSVDVDSFFGDLAQVISFCTHPGRSLVRESDMEKYCHDSFNYRASVSEFGVIEEDQRFFTHLVNDFLSNCREIVDYYEGLADLQELDSKEMISFGFEFTLPWHIKKLQLNFKSISDLETEGNIAGATIFSDFLLINGIYSLISIPNPEEMLTVKNKLIETLALNCSSLNVAKTEVIFCSIFSRHLENLIKRMEYRMDDCNEDFYQEAFDMIRNKIRNDSIETIDDDIDDLYEIGDDEIPF